MVGDRASSGMSVPTSILPQSVTWAENLMSDRGNLLLLLYGKALRCMAEAVDAIQGGDMILKGELLIRAQEIVTQLSEALNWDSGGEDGRLLASNLERLYTYINLCLVRGNNRLDIGAIAEAHSLMTKLLGAWEQIVVGTAGNSTTEEND